MHVTSKLEHLYTEWPLSVYYKEPEIERIHRHFFDPHTDELVNLIHRGKPEHATQDPQKTGQHPLKMLYMSTPIQRARKIPSRNSK